MAHRLATNIIANGGMGGQHAGCRGCEGGLGIRGAAGDAPGAGVRVVGADRGGCQIPGWLA